METYEKIKAMRVEAKLSRKALAEISGFNERTILAFETDERQPSFKYLEFCAFYFGYELDSIQDSAKELAKMSRDEQTNKIFEITKDLNTIADYNYALSKYAEFVKLQSITKKLEKSKQYSKQDLELLALLNSLDAEIKDNLKTLIKSIIAKGGKM